MGLQARPKGSRTQEFTRRPLDARGSPLQFGSMFPLKTNQFPSTSADLAYRLNESLRDVFQLARDPVEVREITYPHLSALTVSLDGAEVKRQPPAMPSVAGNAAPALTVDSFKASGSRLALGPAAIDFN